MFLAGSELEHRWVFAIASLGFVTPSVLETTENDIKQKTISSATRRVAKRNETVCAVYGMVPNETKRYKWFTIPGKRYETIRNGTALVLDTLR